jgi:hypothetical protein
MPLEFDERGLLPAGIHDATLEELEQYFGRFQRTDQRITLCKKLKAYISALKAAEINCSLIVDGSFIMTKVDEPEDIDLVLVLPEDWDIGADLKPYQYNVVAKHRVKQQYRFDLFTVRKNTADEQKWIDFFGQVNVKWCELFGWPDDLTKGVVRVSL